MSEVKKCSNCKEEWKEGHACPDSLQMQVIEVTKVKAVGPDGKE